MKNQNDKPVVIVGGGITGLSLAKMLLERSIPVVVLEKKPTLGGLARSYDYDDFVFDIGPHRFHTDLPHVEKFITDTLEKDYLVIGRSSQVRFKGHFYPWPIHPYYALAKFPPLLALRVLLDLFSLFRKKPTATFRDQIISMYGITLYRHFFEGYSSKFLGITPELTHPDWASTGIDRAIIDNRLKIQTLGQLIKSSLFSFGRPELKFIYPKGGCGRFIEKLSAQVQALGGEIFTDIDIDRIDTHGKTITEIGAGERAWNPSELVWTGTIHSLMKQMKLDEPKLDYLSLICYNLELTQGEQFGFQWSYHGSPDVIFSRVSVPQNFDPSSVPVGRRSMCVEVTCHENDPILKNPDSILDRIVEDLQRQGLLKTKYEIDAAHAQTVPWAYPIYRIDYRDRLKGVEADLGDYGNLTRAGRLGLFWYNNMDHCIESAFRLADQLESRLVTK